MRSLLPPRVRRPGLAVLALACAFVWASCAISPKPEPPGVGSEPPNATNAPPSLNSDEVVTSGAARGTETSADEEIHVAGGAGAASPPGATVRVYNLDSTAPPVETVVRDDGSFEVTIAGTEGDELRIQIIADQDRSAPTDTGGLAGDYGTSSPTVGGIGGIGGAPTDLGPGAIAGAPPVWEPAPDPTACLVLDPPAELVIDQSAVVRVDNVCDTGVAIDEPDFRVPTDAVTLGADLPWPATIAAGSSLSFTVELTTASAFTEEIFFVRALPPASERHAITLRVAQ